MTTAGRPPFDPRIIAAVVVVGVVGFIAMWALIAFGPQLSQGNDGQGHALSRSVAGYAGIVDLAERTDMWVDVRRDVVESQNGRMTDEDPDAVALLVLTPTHDSEPEQIAALIKAHGDGPVLLVLPKWRTSKHKERIGWAGYAFRDLPDDGLIPRKALGGGAAAIKAAKLAADLRAPLTGSGYSRGSLLVRRGDWQVIDSQRARALLALGSNDRSLIVRSPARDFYVLSDPDLINNFAFASKAGARSALAILDAVAEDAGADAIAFDVTLNGFGGGGAGFLKLAFVPPFIGITLCLIAAGVLALWQAAMRFGPALVPARAIAISKLALIESSAELVAQTQREGDAAVPWLRGQREAIGRALHAPPALTGDALDEWIDRRRPARDGAEGFATLTRRLLLARSNTEMLGAARNIHAIRKDLLREHRQD